MSTNDTYSQPAPTDGYYTGVTYNPSYFASTSSQNGVSLQYIEDNFLEKVGNPTDEAQTTTFSGQIISTNPTTSSSNDGAVVLTGGLSCSDIYLKNGTINGSGQTTVFESSETVYIGNQNNGSVIAGIFTANNAGYGVNSAGVINAGTNITAGQYITANWGLVSENLYESVTGTGTGNPTVYCASPNVSIATQATNINLGTQIGNSVQYINCGNSSYNSTTMNLYGLMNIFASININQAVSVFTGGSTYTSGNIVVSMPFQGQSFKMVMIVATNLVTTGILSYTYNYPTAFTNVASVIYPSATLAPSFSTPQNWFNVSSTLSQLTMQVGTASTTNAIILIVGR